MTEQRNTDQPNNETSEQANELAIDRRDEN